MNKNEPLKFKPLYRWVSAHQLEKVAPPEESKRAQRRRASMKANARKAELARVRKAEESMSAEFRQKRDAYFANLKLSLGAL